MELGAPSLSSGTRVKQDKFEAAKVTETVTAVMLGRLHSSGHHAAGVINAL